MATRTCEPCVATARVSTARVSPSPSWFCRKRMQGMQGELLDGHNHHLADGRDRKQRGSPLLSSPLLLSAPLQFCESGNTTSYGITPRAS
eukprot:scaffold5109_cov238-Pinguiococcus_pyrenoidosus.AAC.4